MSAPVLFTPNPQSTVNIAATNASQRVSLAPSAAGGNPLQVRVKNIDATAVAFVEFGGSGVVASTSSSIPIGPGETAGFSLGVGQFFAAAITGTTATVYFTPGYGT